ncbi:MAG TPA: hypothetical protein ENN99_07110 [Chloroflexi bacterium]|nr:hypothetical protein [Chloroflexota bacterium]
MSSIQRGGRRRDELQRRRPVGARIWIHCPRDFCHSPHCQASDTFIGHGAYWRKALDRWEDCRIQIKRWLCKTCRRTVSILPSFLLRRRQYLLAVIQDVVTARFKEDASWGQIEQQGTSESVADVP